MEETGKRKVSAGSLNLCTKASPIDFHGVSLNDDALTQILVRLPAKSVIRFKLVCKSWLSLISSNCFRRLYALGKPPPSLILTALMPFIFSFKLIISDWFYYSNQAGYIKRSNEIQRIMPCDICFDDNVSVLSCCNGLLLFRNKHDNYYVYNPTTNHSEQIILIREYNLDALSLHLVFDPLKSPHHYKIVCFSDDEQIIRAFDSESGKWSECECVEGFTSAKSLFYLIHGGLLYCFNIVKNVSQFILCPLPKLTDQGTVDYDILQESNGCLYYCAFLGQAKYKLGATLWELQVNGEDDLRPSKWLLKYHHRDHCIPGPCMCMLAFISETSTVLFRVHGRIKAYSFPDKIYKEFLNPLEYFTTPIHYYVHVNRLGETMP